jgi:GDP-D-mannose dehydratase
MSAAAVVTGASGQDCYNLAKLLLDERSRVHALVHKAAGADESR